VSTASPERIMFREVPTHQAAPTDADTLDNSIDLNRGIAPQVEPSISHYSPALNKSNCHLYPGRIKSLRCLTMRSLFFSNAALLQIFYPHKKYSAPIVIIRLEQGSFGQQCSSTFLHLFPSLGFIITGTLLANGSVSLFKYQFCNFPSFFALFVFARCRHRLTQSPYRHPL